MKKIIFPLLVFLFLATPWAVFAHQPRIVIKSKVVRIKNPEISQAFYAELKGQPTYYAIESNVSFVLYLNLLVPDLLNIKKDVSVWVYSGNMEDGKELRLLNGQNFNWVPFYEKFASDKYFKGPELRMTLGSGKYLIKVFNSINQGKYVLAIGDKEKFPLGEAISAFILLPSLKKNFFNKSALSAYLNRIGLFTFIFFLTIAGIIFLSVFLFKSLRAGEKQASRPSQKNPSKKKKLIKKS